MMALLKSALCSNRQPERFGSCVVLHEIELKAPYVRYPAQHIGTRHTWACEGSRLLRDACNHSVRSGLESLCKRKDGRER